MFTISKCKQLNKSRESVVTVTKFTIHKLRETKANCCYNTSQGRGLKQMCFQN